MGIISSLVDRFQRRSPSPSEPHNALTVSSAWQAFFPDGERRFGDPVTERAAMQTSAVYRCVTLISGVIASLDLGVYTDDDKRGQVKLAAPFARLLTINPFPGRQMSAFTWKEIMVMNLLLWGNSFSVIRYDGAGRVIGLEYAPPWHVTIQKQVFRHQYRIQWQDGRSEELVDQDDMIHVAGPGDDGFGGMSRIQTNARNSVAMARSIEETLGKAYDDAMSPKMLVELPAGTKPENAKRLEKWYETKFTGKANAGRTLWADSGTKVTALSINVVDLALLEAAKATDVQICAYFGVPPVLLGIDNTTTWGSGIEQILLGFLRFTLNSDLERIEAELTQKLCAKTSNYVLFDRDQLLGMDALAQAQVMSQEISCGVSTINEARRKKHRATVEGGDEPLVNSANVPLARAVTPPPPPPEPTPPVEQDAAPDAAQDTPPPPPKRARKKPPQKDTTEQ